MQILRIDLRINKGSSPTSDDPITVNDRELQLVDKLTTAQDERLVRGGMATQDS
jgi:hypothetical protein